MSVRTTIPTPPPISGVSQQPPHLRLPSHAAAAENAWFDVADGVGKRPGTEINRKFSSTPQQGLKLAVFEYAADERYLLTFNYSGSPRVRAFRIGGNEATVSVSADAATYLGTGSGVIRWVPIGSEGLLINPAAIAAVGTSDTYTVERTRPDSAAVLAYTAAASAYVRAERGDATYPAGAWQYTPGSLTYAHINFNTLTNPWSIHNGYWDDATYADPGGFRIAFRRLALTGFTGATFTTATGTITKTGAFTSYAYRPGDMIYISGGTGFSAGWFAITSRVSNDAITIAGGPGADNVDTAANSTDSDYGETNVCRIGIEVVVSVHFKQKVEANEITDMHGIAAAIQNAMRAAGAANACCAWVPQAAGGNFQITGPYRGTGAVVYRPAASGITGVAALAGTSGQPFDNPADAQIFVGTGSLGASNDSEPPLSRWTRVSAPNQATAKPTATTLPVRVRRTAANTISVEASPWVGRIVGDGASNPAPALFTAGVGITAAALYRQRLFLFGGSHVAGSETGNFWNFYDTSTPTAVDSDPIDRTISGSGNASILRAATFRNGILLFTPAGQYELSGGDTLTPSTATITASTSYASADVQPAAAGLFVHFATPQGQWSGVREYFFDDLRQASEASDITVHVPRLISGDIRAIATSPESRTSIVLAGPDDQLYCYRWFWAGNDKQQSAWGMWQFATGVLLLDIASSRNTLWILNENTGILAVSSTGLGARLSIPSHGYTDGNAIYLSDSTTTPSINGVKYVDVIDANTVDLYDDALLSTPTSISSTGTVRWHTGDYFIEQMPLSRVSARSGEPFSIHTDRQMRLTGTHSAGTTTFTLPSTPTVSVGSAQINGLGSTINSVVKPDGTVLVPNGYTTTTITVSGDHSGVACVLGWQPTWSVTLTRPFIRESSGAMIQDPLYIESVSVSYNDTRAATVRATQSLRVDRDRAISHAPSTSSGVLNTVLSGEASAMTVAIRDTGPGPAFVTGVQYDLDHAPVGVLPRS